LREEITRLSRKESRRQIDPTKKTSAQQRKDIAAMKRQIMQLERQIRALSRGVSRASPKSELSAAPSKVRFVAKGLRSQRDRSGLSAADFGKLIGVSAQSVYNWETEKARPRAPQIVKLAQLRSIGKRELQARLRKLDSPTSQ
jgi:DNA-binding transcriptional regulator YiaG